MRLDFGVPACRARYRLCFCFVCARRRLGSVGGRRCVPAYRRVRREALHVLQQACKCTITPRSCAIGGRAIGHHASLANASLNGWCMRTRAESDVARCSRRAFGELSRVGRPSGVRWLRYCFATDALLCRLLIGRLGSTLVFRSPVSVHFWPISSFARDGVAGSSFYAASKARMRDDRSTS